MGARKIQDEAEVTRWFSEGRTYEWMVQEYARKYHLEVVPSLFGNFRRRRGLPRRTVRDDALIPWAVKEEHRWAYPLAMLRAEGRLRAGSPVRQTDLDRLDGWKRGLTADDAVVHYDPDTEAGFFRVPRRAGVDLDLIREPSRATTSRPAADKYEPLPYIRHGLGRE